MMLRAALSVIALFLLVGCTSTPTSTQSLVELERDLREQRFNRLIVTVRDPRIDRFSNRLRTNRPITFLVTANDLRQQFFGDDKTPGEKLGLELIDSYYVKQLDTYTLVYESDNLDVLARAALELRKDKQINSVIPVNTYQTRTSDQIDPLGNLLPGIRPSTLDAMHEQATGADVDIAIIDTGVDILHEDIAHEQFTLFDMVGADHPPETHGTAIAGIIAAVPGNGIGIRGIAPDASILMLRACWQEDEQTAVCTTDTIAKALALALKAGVDIVNLSLTGPMDPLLEQLVRALIAEGTIVVAAHADTPDHGPFPGTVPGVLAASSTSARDDDSSQALFIPGSGVMTLLPGNRYGPRNGASISAAQLSGLAALFLQRHPGMTAESLYATLRDVHLENGDDTHLVQALTRAASDIQSFAGEPALQE